MKISLLWTPCLLLFSLARSQPSDSLSVTMPAVVVTANRVPVGALQVNRVIEVIDRSLFESVSAWCVEDVLRQFTTLDPQSRGPLGVQTDVSIRGSLFSQNLVLLNGTRLNDPQTAHHNFDLPFGLSQIEKIEVMKGPGSTLYGPDAFGGVINILLKEPSQETGVIMLSGGEHGFLNAAGSHDISTGMWKISNSAEYRRSNGFRDDTDFEIWNVSSNHAVDLLGSRYSFLLGYTKKRFGAFDFYSPGRNVPSKEWTSSGFSSLSSRYLVSSIVVEPSIFYRRHDDKFMFDIRTPDRFVNTHRTDTYGGHLIGTARLNDGGLVTVGVEANKERIKSSGLGDHSRSLSSLFVNAMFGVTDLVNLDGGIRYDVSSTYGSLFNPTIGMGLSLSNKGKLFANAGRSFRAPSYTELYYSDPANEGNAELRPETGWSYELGAQYRLTDFLVTTGSVYLRNQQNLIDYVQFAPLEKFYATNFTSATTRGTDVSFEWSSGVSALEGESFFLQRLLIQYSFMESEIHRKGIFNSKYSLNHPKHQIVANVSGTTPFSIKTNLSGVYKYRSSSRNYLLLNLQLSKEITPLRLFVNVSNMMNVQYEEIVGVPRPGRWAIVGLEWKLWQ